MIVYIGRDYWLDNETKVHVQDTNGLSLTAKVGVPDADGMMFDTQWVEWGRLTENRKGNKEVPK